jgi:hypothetical protein
MMICIAGDCEEQWAQGSGTETVAFLCDGHHRSVNVKAVYEKLKEHNPKSAKWMGSLSYHDNQKSPAIQAGDLLASACKQFIIEGIDNPQESRESIVSRWKPILGGNVGIRCMDKKSLNWVVDANVPRRGGKLSIYSTMQSRLFNDLIVSETTC